MLTILYIVGGTFQINETTSLIYFSIHYTDYQIRTYYSGIVSIITFKKIRVGVHNQGLY